MKICFFGMGSIGKRHLKNLRLIEMNSEHNFEIHAFRSSTRKLDKEIEKLLDKQIYNKKDLENYDIIFITNPTSKHYETIKEYINHTKNMFIEKPIFEKSEKDINNIEFKNNGIYYVAAPLRYNPVIQYFKEKIDPNDVISSRIICSSYLPEWRPNIDYRNVYSAKKELGGGVSIDLIHEIDYTRHLFGEPKRIFNIRNKFSNLEIDTEDLSIYNFQYDDKIVEIHLDYFGRVPRREVEIYTNDEVYIGDLINKNIKLLKENKIINLENNDIYIDELKYFLNKVEKEEKTNNEFDYALKTLEICEGKA
jgi:predicted dehydrogenase